MMNQKISGFTLIEVLIVMTLLGIMMVLLFSSLKICADSWHKGENKIAQVNEVAVVYNFFQQHLAVAKPLLNDLKKNDLQATLAFQGKSQSLQFVSSFPASVGRLGLQIFTVKMDKEDDKQVLKVTITPFFPMENADAEQSREEVVLLKGVSDFSIAYFGSDDGMDNNMSNAGWHDEWVDKTIQPSLVKIIIKQDKETFWPEMLIALKINGLHTPQNQTTNNAVPIR
jgi:general secretion pathway protein J